MGALSDAMLALERSMPIQDLLKCIVTKSCELVGAKYGALELLNPEGREILTSIAIGMSDDEKTSAGDLPKRDELLGKLRKEELTLRVSRVSQEKKVDGFPSSFLRVPLRLGDAIFGNLYVTDKLGAASFSEEDERFLEVLGTQAALAVDRLKQTTQAKNSREKISSIIDHTPEAILFTQTPDGALLESNLAAKKLLGPALSARNLEEWLVASGLKFPDGRPCSISECPIWQALHGDTVTNKEFFIACPDNADTPISMTAIPICEDSPEITGAIVVIHDLSPEKKLDRLRDEFSAVIAHDLRNPIQSISMQAELLLRKSSTEDFGRTETQQALLRIQRNADCLQRIANDLCDATRIDLKRLKLDREIVNPRTALQDLIPGIRMTFNKHTIAIAAAEQVPLILIDLTKFVQILTIIIENAAKSSDEGTRIEVVLKSAEGGVIISIRDHGIGISKENMLKLYNHFFQEQRSDAHTRGLGLGLFIAKGLIDAHGGRIWAESMFGTGSTINIWFPSASSD